MNVLDDIQGFLLDASKYLKGKRRRNARFYAGVLRALMGTYDHPHGWNQTELFVEEYHKLWQATYNPPGMLDTLRSEWLTPPVFPTPRGGGGRS